MLTINLVNCSVWWNFLSSTYITIKYYSFTETYPKEYVAVFIQLYTFMKLVDLSYFLFWHFYSQVCFMFNTLRNQSWSMSLFSAPKNTNILTETATHPFSRVSVVSMWFITIYMSRQASELMSRSNWNSKCSLSVYPCSF